MKCSIAFIGVNPFKYSCFISLQQLIHIHRVSITEADTQTQQIKRLLFFNLLPFFLALISVSHIQISFTEQLPQSASNSLITARVNGRLNSKPFMLIWCRDETSCWSLWGYAIYPVEFPQMVWAVEEGVAAPANPNQRHTRPQCGEMSFTTQRHRLSG